MTVIQQPPFDVGNGLLTPPSESWAFGAPCSLVDAFWYPPAAGSSSLGIYRCQSAPLRSSSGIPLTTTAVRCGSVAVSAPAPAVPPDAPVYHNIARVVHREPPVQHGPARAVPSEQEPHMVPHEQEPSRRRPGAHTIRRTAAYRLALPRPDPLPNPFD